MKSIEKAALSVEEAVESCLAELRVRRNQVTVEILEEAGKKGFLGLFGTKMARVRVCFEELNPGQLACTFLQEMTRAMQVEADFHAEEKNGQTFVNIAGSDLGILIGRRGDTLEAIQFLTNLAVSKQITERARLIIDVEGYRQRRQETLIRLVNKLADKVKRSGNRVVLEPMNPQERRIIHMALQDDPRISTFSEGDEPNRRVVISSRRHRDTARRNTWREDTTYDFSRKESSVAEESRPAYEISPSDEDRPALSSDYKASPTNEVNPDYKEGPI